MIGLGLHAPPDFSSGTTRHADDIAERVAGIFGLRYDMIHPIATGGMATLYKLRHRLHGGLFAVKVLHPELAANPDIIRSFRTEATHAAQLGGHPNAIPVFEFGEQDGLFYMTMPYVEGEDLDMVLRRVGPMQIEEVLLMAAQISSLLCCAESHGIVHADLTPGNLRLDLYGRYHVLDFGVSHSSERPPAASFRGGTPLYSSPEQIEGHSTDRRSDLYALGTILAEALAGVPLCAAPDIEAIHDRHLSADWTLPAILADHADFESLLRKLLARHPEDRMQSATELSTALDQIGYRQPDSLTARLRPQRKQTRPGRPRIRRLD